MNDNTAAAAACGLYCGTCDAYGHGCGGCFSNNVQAGCADCEFRKCTERQHISRCYECREFPCSKLEEFSKKHIVNGIGHHAQVIGNLLYMKKYGVENWVKYQKETHTCALCGKAIPWYEKDCPSCIT